MPPEAYLSRFRLDAKDVVNPYEAHRLLWTSFPGIPDASRPFLFRLPPARSPIREGLMLSTRRPVPSARVEIAACRPFRPVLRAGQSLRFEVTANPVKRLLSGERVPLIRNEEQVAWLRRQLDGAADIEHASAHARETLGFSKPGMNRGKIETVTFRGIAQVKDSSRFLDRCLGGIGPAKSFGCGLLLLARP